MSLKNPDMKTNLSNPYLRQNNIILQFHLHLMKIELISPSFNQKTKSIYYIDSWPLTLPWPLGGGLVGRRRASRDIGEGRSLFRVSNIFVRVDMFAALSTWECGGGNIPWLNIGGVLAGVVSYSKRAPSDRPRIEGSLPCS